jgi:hypothetical protein
MVTSLRTTDRAPHGRFDPRTGPAVQNIRSGSVLETRSRPAAPAVPELGLSKVFPGVRLGTKLL